VLPPGAREVRLQFASASYARGQLVSAVAMLIVLGLMLQPVLSRRKTADA
jgi:hypothetical protein